MNQPETALRIKAQTEGKSKVFAPAGGAAGLAMRSLLVGYCLGENSRAAARMKYAAVSANPASRSSRTSHALPRTPEKNSITASSQDSQAKRISAMCATLFERFKHGQ